MITKAWVEAQLQNEYSHKLRCEGAIMALEGQLKLFEKAEQDAATAAAATRQPEADKQSPELAQQGHPDQGEADKASGGPATAAAAQDCPDAD